MATQKPTLPGHSKPCGLPCEESSSSFWHSQPSPLLTGHRSSRNLPSNADVVIIGSGMTGASVAHHLLTPEGDKMGNGNATGKGPNVVMLEAREACWGATGRNGGHCQPILFEHPNIPSIGRFELFNFHTLQDLIRTRGVDCEFAEQFGVRAIYSDRHMREVTKGVEVLRQTDPENAKRVSVITSSEQLKELRCPTAIGAVVTNIAARMWPYKFVSRILEDLLTSSNTNGSFNLQTLTPASSLQHDSSTGLWNISTPRGSLTAKNVVLATNAYTSHLLPNFADLIVPCRGQMSALQPLPSLQGANRLQTSFGFEGDGMDDYLIQRPNERGGHLMFGGGRQNGPSIGTVDDTSIDFRTALYLRRRLVGALGLPEKKQNHPGGGGLIRGPTELKADFEWTGIMGFSRDDLPWVGAVPEQPMGLWISAGYTGHGMPNTWLCGKSVALMIAMQEAGAENVMDAVVAKTGLPEAYMTSKERIERARGKQSVEERDWAEISRAEEEVRPHSGYA